MTKIEEIIYSRTVEVLNGDGDIDLFISGLADRIISAPGVFSHAVAMVAKCFQSARDGGYIEVKADAPHRDFMAGSLNRMLFDLNLAINCDQAQAAGQLATVLTALKQARANGCVWSIAPDVIEPPPPVAVAIVSMPDRVSRTEVTRNNQGQVTGSSALETNADG